jgi:hypothetical protein
VARTWGGLGGYAAATATVLLNIDVEIRGTLLFPSVDLCLGYGAGCLLTVNFIDDTHGMLAHGSSANFSQLANISGQVNVDGTGVGSSSVDVGGSIDISQFGFVPTVTGDWTTNDLTSFGPTPSTQVSLFPLGDPKNSFPDATGDISGYNFHHIERFGAISRFDSVQQSAALSSHFRVEFTQTAIAGDPSGGYDFSVIAVDFSKISNFSVESVLGLDGQPLDPSLYTINVSYNFVSDGGSGGGAVPEPSAFVPLLTGLSMLLLLRVRRRSQRMGAPVDAV